MSIMRCILHSLPSSIVSAYGDSNYPFDIPKNVSISALEIQNITPVKPLIIVASLAAVS